MRCGYAYEALRRLVRLTDMVDDYDMLVGSGYVKGVRSARNTGLAESLLSKAFDVLVRLLYAFVKGPFLDIRNTASYTFSFIFHNFHMKV